jgi:hypothetical protein
MSSPCCLCVSPYFFVFYAVRFVSKKSKRLVLPITSYLFMVYLTTRPISQTSIPSNGRIIVNKGKVVPVLK